MKDFQSIITDVQGLGLNLYDFAIQTDKGIQMHFFQPSNNCNNSYSIGKAFLMTAVGMLYDEGKLDVHEKLYPHFREYFDASSDPRWQEVTVEHALRHRLGFDHTFQELDIDPVYGSYPIEEHFAAPYPTGDFLRIVFSQRLPYPPGEHHQYSDAAIYTLSRLVSKLTGQKTEDFLRERLLTPMGFHQTAWGHCSLGYTFAASAFYASAADLVKLAWLYMHGGVYEGKRYLSEAWVKLALEREYDMHPRGQRLLGKRGMNGQGMMFSRDAGFAVAWHGFEKKERIDELIAYLDGIEG